MKRLSIVAMLAIILGTTGCCCFRRQPAAPVAATCPAPAPVVCDPCAPGGAVTYGYGSSGYSSGYGTPMMVPAM